MIRAEIKGIGGYLPKKILTNADLEKMVDTSDAWITERTGIQSRHIADTSETTADLAIAAAKIAIENAGIMANDIDLIILATTTPNDTTPATAMHVQKALDITHGFAFDVQAACSGFMYGLSIADKYIQTGTVKNALVIGAETLSRIVDWQDRNTCVLFGDGAGAVVLGATQQSGTNQDTGILNIILHANGHLNHLLTTTGGVSRTQNAGYISMEGREVFRHAVNNLSGVAEEVLASVDISLDEVAYLVPHQANMRIIEGTAKKLNLPMDRVIITLPQQGNTSAASITLAFYHGFKTGQLKKGDLVLLDAMGAGFTWAGGLIRL